MTCCYEKPVWRTCDLAGKDKVFELSYDVLIVAVGFSPLSFHLQLAKVSSHAVLEGQSPMWM